VKCFEKGTYMNLGLQILIIVSNLSLWLGPTIVVVAGILLVRPMVGAFRRYGHVRGRNKDPLTTGTVASADLRFARKRLAHGLAYLAVVVGLVGVAFGLLPRGLLAMSPGQVPEWLYYADLGLIAIAGMLLFVAALVRISVDGAAKK